MIYINDLANGLSSNTKLFTDDTSLFSVVHNANTTAKELNDDLVEIDRWTYNGKWVIFKSYFSYVLNEYCSSGSTEVSNIYHGKSSFSNWKKLNIFAREVR